MDNAELEQEGIGFAELFSGEPRATSSKHHAACSRGGGTLAAGSLRGLFQRAR